MLIVGAAGGLGKIGRADLADFVLDQLDDHGYVRKVVVAGY